MIFIEEYPQVRPTNPLYSSTFSLRSHSSAISNLSKTSTVVERRKKFDPHTPKHPDDWRWFAMLCILLFPFTGILFNIKMYRKFDVFLLIF